MSLLQKLSYPEYKKALAFSPELCEVVAKLANLKIPFNDTKKPGELLMKTLDRAGYKVQQYHQLVVSAQNTKFIHTYYKPQAKVAILMAYDKYVHLSKLATPSMDCDSLGSILKNLGFIVIILKNAKVEDLKCVLKSSSEVIPENSYCFIFYAGHGCELCNTKCMLGMDCPTEDISIEHCITENFVLNEVSKCKPELCILIMDMCRIHLDRTSNPRIYASIPLIEDYCLQNNLLISYSTQSSQAAYEVLQIECSKTIDNNCTFSLKTGDMDKIVPGASQYVNALCTRLGDDLDVNTILDKVHADVENSIKKQRPIKLQCGVAKRSLYDPVTGDTTALLEKLKDLCKEYKENCNVF